MNQEYGVIIKIKKHTIKSRRKTEGPVLRRNQEITGSHQLRDN
jgi:hypothetical protein